jgi:hypothetical protein
MITHDMGNTLPPANRHLMIVEWSSKMPGEKSQEKSAMLQPGWEVREQFRDEYWVAHKMHGEFATICRANGKPLPGLFIIILENELIGCGHYKSEDLHDRAMADTTIREFEWEQRGTGQVPMIGVIMGDLPEDQEVELVRRTGTTRMGMQGEVDA